jgi:hypothetical protein
MEWPIRAEVAKCVPLSDLELATALNLH